MPAVIDDTIACYTCARSAKVHGSFGLDEARKYGWRAAAGDAVWICPVCAVAVLGEEPQWKRSYSEAYSALK